jgi:hypothetical protein
VTAHTLSEILRLGRPYDPEGQEVVMSRQACEEAADQLEVLAADIKAMTNDRDYHRAAAMQQSMRWRERSVSWRTDDLLCIRKLESAIEEAKENLVKIGECAACAELAHITIGCFPADGEVNEKA